MNPNAKRNLKSHVYWLKRHFPGLYYYSVGQALNTNELGALGQPYDYSNSGIWGQFSLAQGGPDYKNLVANTESDKDAAWYEKILSFAEKAIPVFVQAEAQENILDVQIKRAKMGLEPLNVSQISPQVNVGLAPAIQESITGLSTAVQSVLVYGGIGLVAYFLFFNK